LMVKEISFGQESIFRVEDGSGWLWIEVKSWDPRRITPKYRGGSRRKFLSRLRSDVFAAEVKSKFFGTTAFLAWIGTFVPSPVTYVVLLQPPRPSDKALLGSMLTRIQGSFPRKSAWIHPINVAIVDVNDWNTNFSHLPARIL